MIKAFPQNRAAPDYFFLIIVLVLVVFGLVMLGSASSDLAQKRFGESYYYIIHQLTNGFIVGLLGFAIGYFVYYRVWEKLALVFLGISVALLALTFTPLGISLKGAERWLDLGFASFQPSELVKIMFLIYVAAWVSGNKERISGFFRGFLPFLLLLGLIAGMLFLQPATTAAVILILAAMAVYFIAGAKWRYLLLLIFLAIAAVGLLIYFTPYRFDRLTSFLNPEADPQGKTYQINQSLIAIGSGGWQGVGFGNSTAKFKYLPESIGDSIFAVIAEELGFIGSALLLLAFIALIYRGFFIAQNCHDNFGKYLALGFVVLIGLQAFINIGANSGILPLTGIPLPFVSYGGTALAVFLTMCGIILNISRQRR